jgi:Pentapeptide repeats (9 copies)
VYVLQGAKFSGGEVSFDDAEFSGGEVRFVLAKFSGATVSFGRAKFSGGAVSFGGMVSLVGGQLGSGQLDSGQLGSVGGAEFSGGEVRFDRAQFTGGQLGFRDVRFTGGLVSFRDAEFTGGTVDFGQVAVWTNRPKFDWDSTPPPGVSLLAAGGRPSAPAREKADRGTCDGEHQFGRHRGSSAALSRWRYPSASVAPAIAARNPWAICLGIRFPVTFICAPPHHAGVTIGASAGRNCRHWRLRTVSI